ncbi:MAG: precorrin-4 C(11)-methyltransferase [Desulfonatronovibrio sp. MSAO_Bac4]|nr:MAG: precorrin-4 C(11)-methyltransferase [Desulfonatronovibrio sp. MSAO_Bac4]
MSSTEKVIFVGAGPGDPELITVKGLKAINQADLIIYAGSLVPPELFEHSKARDVIDSSNLTLEQTNEMMVKAFGQGRSVVRVHTGDPSIFGTIHEQTRLLSKQGIPFEIIPGVTSAFAAAARANISFTLPEVSQTLIITRSSGRTKVPQDQSLTRLASTGSSMAVYLSAGLAKKVQADLLEGGMKEDTKVIIGWKIGWDGEEIIETNLKDLAQTVENRKIKGQAVFLILPSGDNEKRSKLYDPCFSHGFRKNDTY